MNWRTFSRKFGEILLPALAFALGLGLPIARALGSCWSATPAPALALGMVLGAGTARALREGILPGAITLSWPPPDWKEVDVRDVRRQLLRASAWVLTITAATVVAPLTYAITGDLRPTLLVAITYLAFATLAVSNVYARTPQMIDALRAVSRSGPPTLVWEPDRVLALRYPVPLRILITLLSLPPVIVGVGALLGVFRMSGSRTEAVLSLPLILGFSAFLSLEANFVSIVVDQTGIVHRSPWRRRRNIPWSEVLGHSRTEFGQSLIIHTEQGKVTVSEYLSGSFELGERLWLRVLK